MKNDHFNLNDTLHEPSDIQLQTLMTLVAAESNRRAILASKALMQRLRDQIIAANRDHDSKL